LREKNFEHTGMNVLGGGETKKPPVPRGKSFLSRRRLIGFLGRRPDENTKPHPLRGRRKFTNILTKDNESLTLQRASRVIRTKVKERREKNNWGGYPLIGLSAPGAHSVKLWGCVVGGHSLRIARAKRDEGKEKGGRGSNRLSKKAHSFSLQTRDLAKYHPAQKEP